MVIWLSVKIQTLYKHAQLCTYMTIRYAQGNFKHLLYMYIDTSLLSVLKLLYVHTSVFV